MTVEYAKESTFRPIVTFFARRLHNVKNYGDSIFIIVSYYTLVSICSISRYNSIFSYRALCLFKVWQNHCIWVWVRGISEKQSVNIGHAGRRWSTCCIVMSYMTLQGLSEALRTLTSWNSVWESVFNLIVRQRSKTVLRNLSVRCIWSLSTKWCCSLQNFRIADISTAIWVRCAS